MRIRIGTRGSDLALWQARHVASLLGRDGHATEIVVLETRGDRIDDVPLQTVEGKGFFTREIEEALLDGRVDLAVHSHKDLPSAEPPGLVIAAVPRRADPSERLLIAPGAHAPAEPFLPLARAARVGTSAPRRSEQLAVLRPDLALLALRGNVPTRVRRLREGKYDAILLAAAGLERLELVLDDLVVVAPGVDRLVPSPGQGALAVQARAADRELCALCARLLGDADTAAAVAAERSLLATLGGGCNLPLGVLVTRRAGRWHGHAFLGSGRPRAGAPARWLQASAAEPAAVARVLAARLLSGEETGEGPLGGLALALTGARDSAAELEQRLVTLGARVSREEVLALEDLPCPELAARVAALRPGDALALTSAHAAARLRGLRLPPGVLVGAVGPATAAALAAAGIPVHVLGTSGARELARSLELARGARVLFPCAEAARPDLGQELAARGVEVERLVLYRTHVHADARPGNGLDARVYLSPSAVQACLAWERAAQPSALRIALGLSTSRALEGAGLPHRTAPGNAPDNVVGVLLAARAAPASAATDRAATDQAATTEERA